MEYQESYTENIKSNTDYKESIMFDESGRGTPQKLVIDNENDDGDSNEIDDEIWVGRGNIGGDGSKIGDHSYTVDKLKANVTLDNINDINNDDEFQDNDVEWVGTSGTIKGKSDLNSYQQQEYEDDGYDEPQVDGFDDDAGAYDDADY